MANADTPMGAWPAINMFGGNLGQIISTKVKASQTVYQGDIVSADATGTVAAATANDGVIVVGVAAEYKVGNSSGTTDIAIWPAYMYLFGIQTDTGTTVAATAVWATANHVAGSGNATTKMSGHELDASDLGTGLQMRVIDKINTPSNNWGEAHVDALVIFNEHVWQPSGATI